MAKLKLKEGDLVVIEALDHFSDDPEGWHSAADAQKISPVTIHIVGWLVNEDADYVTVAQAKGQGNYTTFFKVVKGTIKKISRGKI